MIATITATSRAARAAGAARNASGMSINGTETAAATWPGRGSGGANGRARGRAQAPAAWQAGRRWARGRAGPTEGAAPLPVAAAATGRLELKPAIGVDFPIRTRRRPSV